MWDSKGCGVKGYKAKKALGPKIRPSKEPTRANHAMMYFLN